MDCKSMNNALCDCSAVMNEKREKVEEMTKKCIFFRQKFGTLEKSRTFASRLRNNATKT